MIKKIKGKYVVLSEKTGRSFGRYNTLAGAKKRLRQVEFFKHLKQNPAVAERLKRGSSRKN